MKFSERIALVVIALVIPVSGQAQAPNLSKLMMSAEQGSADSQYALGVLHSVGDVVPADTSMALNWFRRAAEGGNVDAQYNIGTLNIPSTGEPLNSTEGVYWYRKAAEAGHARAQYNLGLIYMDGKVAPANNEKAIEWLEKADENGISEAAYYLGVAYDKGVGVERSPAAAAGWYSKAVEAGDHRGLARLAWFYEAGTGVDKSPAKAKELLARVDISNDPSAVMFLASTSALNEISSQTRNTLADNAATADAMFLVATLFEDGTQDRPADYAKAAEWFEKAAEAGHLNAPWNLAVMLVDPKYGLNDPTRALPWLKLSADKGNSEAAVLAGHFLATQSTPDFDGAIRYYELAAAESSREIAPVLGDLYLKNGDQDNAVKWLRKAAEAGDSRSAKLLANTYFKKGDATAAFAWNHRAADSGDADAAFNLGLAYESGKGTDVDLKQAVSWYRKAAAKDQPSAQYRLGRLIYQGSEGISQSETEALIWLNKSATLGNTNAVAAVKLLADSSNGQ